ITYTKAADDCIFSYLDAESWDIEWNRSGSVGGGAAAYIKDGEYWYTLIESPDLSIGYGGPGQMWPFGLLRSKTLTNTEWEIWSENPPPELTPVVEFAAWNYPSLFEDEGITYLGISQENPNTYRIFRLEWKEGAVPLTAPSPKRRELPPRFEGTPTGTVYEADMNSKEGWNLMHSLAEGEVSVFTVEDGRYTLAMDQISRPLKIDLTKNPVFSVTVDEFDAPKLFVRLQIPGLAARPGYDPGYIGFEPLGFDGVQTFNINEELEWAGYFDSNEAGVKDCVLYVWAYQCEAVISDIRIEYYE
ncbi:MAG: hypothetical protein FWH48_05710, partial [Oscillospiraceae bacterium]|nr:hypothetical protein [Oscillospiraceae bacterium]